MRIQFDETDETPLQAAMREVLAKMEAFGDEWEKSPTWMVPQEESKPARRPKTQAQRKPTASRTQVNST